METDSLDVPKTVADATAMSANNVMLLSVLATVGIIVMWMAFWYSSGKAGEKPSEVLNNPAFFRTVVVIGVIAAVTVLSLAGRIEGNISGSVLSGIVGYVLGQLSSRKEAQ